MAKALTKPQPTSSVNRFLKGTAFEGALDPVEDLRDEQLSTSMPIESPKPATVAISQSRVAGEIVPKREPKQHTQRQMSFEVVLPSDMNDLVNELHAAFRDNSGASLNRSQLFRAMLRAVKQNMRGIEKEAARLGPLRRPSNNPGFEEDRELFEETLAQVFSHHGARIEAPWPNRRSAPSPSRQYPWWWLGRMNRQQVAPWRVGRTRSL